MSLGHDRDLRWAKFGNSSTNCGPVGFVTISEHFSVVVKLIIIMIIISYESGANAALISSRCVSEVNKRPTPLAISLQP